MDFDHVLNIASQNQGHSNVQQKRYSLQAGPPKKDPKSKGVNPAAVQALLKKRSSETRKKEMEMKKQKDDLLAKRVELKSDRKARAMASRTKDNFKGYNGIPVLEVPKKRGSKLDKQLDELSDSETFRNDLINPNDEDNYDYEQTDSEPEQELEMQRPGRTIAAKVTSSSSSSSSKSSKKPCGQPRPAPSALNFADLLKLAEKKQFEPVELKPKVVKKEERLRTADEIRELEMERKAKGLDRNRDSKAEPSKNSKPQPNLVRKSTQQKEQKLSKPQTQKNSFEKPGLPSDQGKKPHLPLTNDRGLSSSKPLISDRERSRDKVYHSDRERSTASMSSKSGAIKSKVPPKAQSSQVSAKQGGPRPSSATQKISTSSDLSFRRDSLSSHQKGASGISGNRPSSSSGPGQKPQQGSSHQTRPIQGGSSKQGPTAGGIRSGKGEPVRPGCNSVAKLNSSSGVRPSLGGPPKAGIQPQGRHGGTIQNKPGSAPQVRPSGSGPHGHPGSAGFRLPGAGPGRPGSGGVAPGRPTASFGSGPGRPKCTVVSETISSKNVGGSRPGVPPRPGMQQRPGMVPRPGMQQRPGMVPRPGMQQRPGMVPRPGMPPRPMMNRPPGPTLPPITSAYKRKYEDEEEEYDPEMDDFIDDGGEEQDEISRHIREIFGYDRSKYKEESDYALKFMESSWKDMQNEEARSLRMAVQEDLEEERREEEELKRQKAKRKKPN